MNPHALFRQAQQAHQRGRLRQAADRYREVLRLAPGHADASHFLGLALAQAGQPAEALPHLRQAAAALPQRPDVFTNLGEAERRTGNLEAAARAYHKALRLDARFAPAHYNLANVLKTTGALGEAVKHYEQAVRHAPTHAGAFYNLGNTLMALARYASAERALREAVRLRPDHAEAHNNLGAVHKHFDRTAEAEASFRAAIARRPSYADAHRNLGQVLEKQGRRDDARAAYEEALRLSVEAGTVSPAEARAHRLRIEALAPIIPASDAAIDAYRTDLAAALDQFEHEAVNEGSLVVDPAHLNRVALEPPMLVTYQGRDGDRVLKERWGALVGAARTPEGTPLFPDSVQFSPWTGGVRVAGGGRPTGSEAASHPEDRPPPAPPVQEGGYSETVRHDRRPHIGFVVTSGHEGVFLKGMKGLIQRLPARGIRVTVACGTPVGPLVVQPAIHDANVPGSTDVEILPLPNDIAAAAEALRAARCDVLHFWEVGTDTTNYLLPLYRCAPTQVTSWGWPSTSGLAAMDAMLTTDGLDPSDYHGQRADDHYTERLVRLEHLPTYYFRPPVPDPLPPRSRWGFTPHQRLYLCAQNLRKVHPSMDALVAEILRRDEAQHGDGHGRVLFIADKEPTITAQFRARIDAALGDLAAHAQVLDRMDAEAYLGLVAQADVLLDTRHYGGGANTVFDACAAGTPIVTWPTVHQRSRWTAAVYHRLVNAAEHGTGDRALADLRSLVVDSADAYAAQAVAWAADRDRCAALRAALHAADPLLFEDDGALDDLAAFVRDAASSRST
ncbi:MAG: tetratricopeptide repeat protein [Bacteroidota bacterium]